MAKDKVGLNPAEAMDRILHAIRKGHPLTIGDGAHATDSFPETEKACKWLGLEYIVGVTPDALSIASPHQRLWRHGMEKPVRHESLLGVEAALIRAADLRDLIEKGDVAEALATIKRAIAETAPIAEPLVADEKVFAIADGRHALTQARIAAAVQLTISHKFADPVAGWGDWIFTADSDDYAAPIRCIDKETGAKYDAVFMVFFKPDSAAVNVIKTVRRLPDAGIDAESRQPPP